MTEVYVFKILGDWQVVPTSAYELDICKGEVVLRPVNTVSVGIKNKDESDAVQPFKVPRDEGKSFPVHVFPSASKALEFVQKGAAQQ
mmetsp:Transcript_5831/g.6336  ORF Transcript_5831/g.6336 Transcript_5831/m.6336 type:complete len:87 (+) Transcript_5831:74-334(+)